MRVEFSVPLTEVDVTYEEGDFNRQLDGFLNAAIDFATTHPVFTAQQLHEHLLAAFPLSDDPAEFWECFESLRDAMQAALPALQPQWAHWPGGYERGFFTLRFGQNDAENIYELSDDEHLLACLKQELQALLNGRPYVSEHELLFYLKEFQACGDDARTVLAWLVEDQILDQLPGRHYALPPVRADKPKAAKGQVVTMIDGVVVVITHNPSDKPKAPVAKQDVPLQPGPEVSPPLPDPPFTVDDSWRALIVLNRLAWQNARSDGVPVSTLVSLLDDGATPYNRIRSIIGRLWRRGYLLRNTRDPHDSIMRLDPDLPEDPREWRSELTHISYVLAQPYIPAKNKKAG